MAPLRQAAAYNHPESITHMDHHHRSHFTTASHQRHIICPTQHPKCQSTTHLLSIKAATRTSLCRNRTTHTRTVCQLQSTALPHTTHRNNNHISLHRSPLKGRTIRSCSCSRSQCHKSKFSISRSTLISMSESQPKLSRPRTPQASPHLLIISLT